jgi:hypothetical protein
MPGTTAVYIARGEAVFDFTIPAELQAAQVRNLKLNLWSDAGIFTAPETAIYDWQAGDWITLEGINQGINLIPASPQLISDTGKLRVRLAGENLQYCYYLDMGLEASR